jgi:hypothetical protein
VGGRRLRADGGPENGGEKMGLGRRVGAETLNWKTGRQRCGFGRTDVGLGVAGIAETWSGLIGKALQ